MFTRRVWQFRSSLACMSSGARDVSVQLTLQEEELFDVLTKTLEHEKLDTVLRCAGGWVRDKLLKKESHDIDIAIDNKMGQELAEHINSYLSSRDMKTGKVPLCLLGQYQICRPKQSHIEYHWAEAFTQAAGLPRASHVPVRS